MLKYCLSTLYVALSCVVLAQSKERIQGDSLPQILVKNTWATDFTPVTFKNFTAQKLEKNDFGQDLPYLLQNTPSVVVTSDAGSGVGYTGFRIRGSDPTRVNVTVNGIPYNDAESQQVYWVDMPDIFSSTESVQIQRGVGTSANGAGAFGASINLNTNTLQLEKGAEIKTTIGSFGTKRLTLKRATGIHKGFSMDAKFSKINSDGYIDRASSDLMAYDFGLSWVGKKNSLRFNFIDGHERTYQAWYGLPIQLLDTQRTFNPAGTEKADSPYANQVDDYAQTHYQLFYNQVITNTINFNIADFATKGKGFYEEYKHEQALADKYGIVSKDTSDAVQRRWLDNWFYGTVWGLHYQKNKMDATLGGGYTVYDGNHFGTLIWSAVPQKNTNFPHRWYADNGLKKDFNVYGKINYLLHPKLNAYVDLQYRKVSYDFIGQDQNKKELAQSVSLNFFNPKVGLMYVIDSKSSIYTTFGIANREPNRDDYVQSSPESRPKSERLQNLEIGWKYQTKKAYFNANIYDMHYQNQLVLTGEINDVGAANRVNVLKSYRVGLELEAGYAWKKWIANANLTLSQNKILNFVQYVDDWDTGEQHREGIAKTNIAYSPNVIGSYELEYHFSKKLNISFLGKHVGKQYLDNSSSEVASLAAYHLNDVRASYDFAFTKKIKASLSLQVSNIFDQHYSSNAWTYAFRSANYDPTPDDPYSIKERNAGNYRLVGLFPQAGRNFLVGFKIKF